MRYGVIEKLFGLVWVSMWFVCTRETLCVSGTLGLLLVSLTTGNPCTESWTTFLLFRSCQHS